MSEDVLVGSALGMGFEVLGSDAGLLELLAGFARGQGGSEVGGRVHYEVRAPHGEQLGELTANGQSLGLERSMDGLRSSLLRDISSRAVTAWSGPVVHACAVTADGRTLMICGPSGCGKSTLAARLVAEGWALLAEDLCALGPDGRVQPFPRPFGLARSSLDLLGKRFPSPRDPLSKHLVDPSFLDGSYCESPKRPNLTVLLDAEVDGIRSLGPASGFRWLLEREAISIPNGAALAVAGAMACSTTWRAVDRSSAGPMLSPAADVASEAVFHCRAEEVPEGTIAWIGDEGFLLRPDNTLLHLNGPAAELGVTWAAGKSQRGGVTSP